MYRSIWLLVLAVTFAIPATVFGQDRRLELGGGMSFVIPAFPGVSGAARANLTSTTKVGLTLILPMAEGVRGVYGLEVRQYSKPASHSIQGFATIGVAGLFKFRHIPEYRSTAPTGDVFVYRAHWDNEVSPPRWLMGGGGVRMATTSRICIEIEADGILADPVGLAVSIGFFVPLGR